MMYGNIMSNVSDYISPVKLQIILGDLAGRSVRISGWGKISDSKYNFLIISHFKLKQLNISEWLFQRERNLWPSETFVVTGNNFYLYYDIQSVKSL